MKVNALIRVQKMWIKNDDVQYYYFWKAKIKVTRSYKALQQHVLLSVGYS